MAAAYEAILVEIGARVPAIRTKTTGVFKFAECLCLSVVPPQSLDCRLFFYSQGCARHAHAKEGPRRTVFPWHCNAVSGLGMSNRISVGRAKENIFMAFLAQTYRGFSCRLESVPVKRAGKLEFNAVPYGIGGSVK